MEKNKNSNSIILMLLGVLFVVIAGGIFVTTAWKYIPDFVKTLLLLVVAFGFFGGAIKASQSEKLKCTKKVLFYLGSIFLGFFTVSVTGGFEVGEAQWNAFRILLGTLVTAVPVSINFLERKCAFEFNVLIVLVNMVSFCIASIANFKFEDYYILFLFEILFLTILQYFMHREEKEETNIIVSIRIQALLHQILGVVMLCNICLIQFFSMERIENDFKVLLIGVLITIISTVVYATYQNIFIRIINSVVLYYFIYIVVSYGFGLGVENQDTQSIFIVSFVFQVILSIWLLRKEMIIMNAIVAFFAPLVQVSEYFISYISYLRISGLEETTGWSKEYIPYNIIFAIGLFLLSMRLALKQEETEEIRKKLLYVAGIQAIVGILLWMASNNAEMLQMLPYFICCTTILCITFFVENDLARAILKTIALLFGILTFISQSFIPIPSAFVVEWICAIFAVGIVLVGYIWYDNKNVGSVIQFTTTCILFGILLLNNMINSNCSIMNVLILGVAAVLVLIFSLMKNHKEYFIASSVTLGLMAFYITRAFWFSIAWWVYLFVVGIFFIVLAIKKEREE